VLLDGRADLAETHATSDRAVVAALLRGDEAAFLALVERHHRAMIQLARLHLRSEALAEEVAQDCWVVVLRSLGQWTGRGTLRSWILGIVVNQARSRATRESRTIPLSMLEPDDAEHCAAGVSDGCGWQWATDVAPDDLWSRDSLDRREILDRIRAAIETLPPRQRAVIELRDVAGCDGPEACAALRLSEANQRVLLHRARVKVRNVVEAYLRS
jgi:RNA polymerase sigma-70 factor (ECF subfamily)